VPHTQDCLFEVLRTQNSELWFDGDREPAKKDYLITAISSSMKEQRTEILNRKTSAIADLKGGRDLGRMHGLMRLAVVQDALHFFETSLLCAPLDNVEFRLFAGSMWYY
jgi:hypothetical protein